MDLFNTQVKIGIDTKAFVNGVKEAERVNKELTKEIEKTKDETKDLGKEVDNEGKQAQESAGENKNLGDKIKTAGDQAHTASSKFAAVGKAIKNGVVIAAKTAVTAVTAVTGATAAMSAALIKGVDSYTTYGDNIDKMSQKLNMSATAYQEWAAIMEHSGTSIDSLQSSMKTLANAVENENEAFERLGISQEEIAAMNNEQLFSRTITALQNVENETERTYLAGQLLGRGATELGALLNTSAEDTEKMRQRVHELGGVMSDEAVKASAKYKDSIQDMKTAFAGMGRGLISDFVPALTQVSDGLTEIFAGNDEGSEMLMKGFDNALSTLSRSTGKLKPIIKKMASVAAEIVPQIISTVGEGIFNSAPAMLEAGKNTLKNIAEGIENASFDGSGILGKILDSITDNSADYFSYGEKIIAGISNSIINLNYSKLGSSFSTIVKNALGSMTDLLADLDSRKIGNDIADFVKSVDWKGIARNIVDLIGAAIGSLGDIATGFFENMDGETFMTALSFLAAPKLLGGMLSAFKGPKCATEFTNIKDYLSQEIGGSGEGAGMTWSSAFLAGIKAFGLGWAIGTYLRDNITIGDKTIGEWVDYAFDQMESKGEKEEAQDKLIDEYGSFYYKNSAGNIVKGNKYDASTTTHLSDAFIKAAESGNVQYSNMAEVVQGMRGIIEKDNETTDFYFDPILAKRADHNAIGNYIDRPTLTWAAENEPEYMIPESKMDEVYPRNNGNTYFGDVHIHIEGYNVQNDDRMAELISEKLAELSIRQQRALGGAAW